ncbi:prepilin peptidase [Bryobacter aggregatus]|uniref:prepilin peptidase n=1 Tax=Bryobacter aggregatus TaxID=360054 RepID=UPI00068D4E65|nr:A24 family peptidase [Bryobacter aggregatus]
MFEILLAAVFGLVIGSFLNVCIYRLPRDLSVVAPRSFCPECGTPIPWYHNIPVLSWLLLRGKCSHCQAPISWRYPLVELTTSLLFALALWRYGPTPDAIKLCLFSALIVGLIFMDLEERILADELTIGGMSVGFLLSIFVAMPRFIGHFFLPPEWRENWLSLGESLIGGLAPALALFTIGEVYYRIRGREGLGLGDVKMIGMVGAFYGLQGALLTLIIGSLTGSIVGLLFITLTKKDAKTYELPFGTFLGFAALLPPFLFPEPGGLIGVPW